MIDGWIILSIKIVLVMSSAKTFTGVEIILKPSHHKLLEKSKLV